MKRLLILVVGVALVVAACGGDDDDAASTTTVPAPATTAALVDVQVFFSTGDATDCEAVEAVDRKVPGPAVLTGAMEQLLAGPTDDERAAGLSSWFGPETAGMLRSAEVVDGTAKVDFESFATVIPNASTSCGSAKLLAELDATAEQFPTVEHTLYSFDGDPAAFYGWLQLEVPALAA